MPAGIGRLLPFLAASVAAHVLVFVTTGPDALMVHPAPAGEGHEVSIRLEAAAPASAAADSAKQSDEAPGTETTSQPRPPEPETKPAEVAQLEAVPEPTDKPDAGPERKPRDAPETSREAEAGNDRTGGSEPAGKTADDETQPAERIAEVEDAATGNAGASSEAQRAEARKAIVAELARHFSYPRLAQRRGWEGTVVLTVRILPDGRLDEIRIKRSSGRTLLDRSARRALAHVQRLPAFADRVGEDGLALEIPVTYRLESA